MSGKVFSGIDRLPNGEATLDVLPGCMVLEGGAFRSLYEEGVLDALMEAGINLECTIGVSAGALNGTNYVSGQIGRSARLNLRYRHDSRYVNWAKIFQYGSPINFDFIFYHLPDDFLNEELFFRPDKRYIAVATSCMSGRPVYFDRDKCSDIFRAIIASSRMQYISTPVVVDGIPCLDGGCSVKIPYRWALHHDFSKIVIVRNRVRSYRYSASYDHMLSRFYHKYPKFEKTLSTTHARSNREYDEIDRLEQEGRVFVIAPSKNISCSRMESDVERLGTIYYLGYEDGKNAIEGLKTYLSS